jgi:hypothetical protein
VREPRENANRSGRRKLDEVLSR